MTLAIHHALRTSERATQFKRVTQFRRVTQFMGRFQTAPRLRLALHCLTLPPVPRCEDVADSPAIQNPQIHNLECLTASF